MCKSMNALFCPFMDKEQESSFWTNCPEVQIKKEVLMMRIRLKAIIQWSGITLI